MIKKFILITGCSSGIGYATAKYLKKKGYNVIISCKNIKDTKKLSKEFDYSINLDLCSTISIKKSYISIKKIINKNNLYAIFCNSGYGQMGALEDLTRKQISKQFETNIFGHIELINLFLPIMRYHNEGRIIFNSSVLGLVSLPFSSAYNASKFSMEAFANSLRIELKNTKIKVSLIEPGPIESRFNYNAIKYLKSIDLKKSFHHKKYLKMLNFLKKGKNSFTLPAIEVSKKVHKILSSENPKLHYYVTIPTYLLSYSRILPNILFEKVVNFINKRRY